MFVQRIALFIVVLLRKQWDCPPKSNPGTCAQKF